MPRGAPPDLPQAACPAGCEAYYERSQGGATATWCELPDGRKHGPYIEWWSRGQMRMRGQYQFGGRTGTWLSFSSRGIRTREIEFWEGDIHGKAAFWYDNGQPWKAGSYRRNLEHGEWAWYHPEGGKWLTGRYESGKKHGVWRQYAKSGRILGESSFDHGTGRDVVFYDNGLVQAQADYIDGKKHGQAICWHDNGKKAFVQGWESGHPAGRWITWDELGNVIKVEEYTGHKVGHTEDTKLGDQTQVFRRRVSLTKTGLLDVSTSKLYNPDEATEILADEAR
ncbi:MAG: hypothetical protein KJO07_10965, partial [Deltaproteobacteria bacterium]|nr:hypothetical protein [Deltaproteobacteria bacterium]